LKQGTPEHDYGYDITPNNIKIWETNWSMLSKGNLPGMLSQFLSPDAF